MKKPLRQFNLAMAVIHGEGLRVFSEAYSDQHALPDLQPGEYTLRFQVPMRFFKMESYFLTLAMNENGKHCDQVDGLLMPEIVDENPNLQMESHALGRLAGPGHVGPHPTQTEPGRPGDPAMKNWLTNLYNRLPVIRDIQAIKTHLHHRTSQDRLIASTALSRHWKRSRRRNRVIAIPDVSWRMEPNIGRKITKTA